MVPPPAAGAGAAEAAPSTSTDGSSRGSSSGGGGTSPPWGSRQQQQQGPLAGNGMAKFVVFILLLGNLIMLPNVLQNTATFLPIQSALRGKEFVLSSSPSALPVRATTAASVPTDSAELKEEAKAEPQQEKKKQEQEAPADEDKAAAKEGKGKDEEAEPEKEKEKEKEKPADDKKPAAAAAAPAAAMVPAAVAPPKDFCHFPFVDIDPNCKRFISIDFRWTGWAGLGDRFLQYIVGLTYAIHVGAFLLNTDATMAEEGVHGTYEWIPDFFKLNAYNANMTLEEVQKKYGNMTVIERVEDYGGVYKDRIAKLRDECDVVIKVNNDDCINGRECYFAEEPRVYDTVHNVLSCWFLQTDRASLPPLIYDPAWYNVVVHLRVGDLTLFSAEKGGHEFFTTLKAQLDTVLATTFPVHWHFFAEAEGTRSAQADYGKVKEDNTAANKTNAVFGEPPSAFVFLRDIFQQRPDPKAVPNAKPQRVSFVNNLDVRAAVFHQMNADMVVTTGSSFPMVAVTVSPKPVVVFSRTKEGGFFPATIRPDYALLNDTGLIFEPTLSELRARVLIRYAEVHDKVVPYQISIADAHRMRRWRRGLI